MKLKRSTDGSTETKSDYSKRIIFNQKDFPEPGHLLQVVTIPPNTRQRNHTHGVQTEIFYILEGNATLTINGKAYVAYPGDAFICEPGDQHSFHNETGSEFRLVVFKINKDESSEDTVWSS